MTTKVPERLRNAANLYEERNKLYKDNYKHFGRIMAALFPEGLTVQSPDDWNRVGLFVQVVGKITRYPAQWKEGGHPDSLDDVSVYSQMLAEVDDEIRNDVIHMSIHNLRKKENEQ